MAMVKCLYCDADNDSLKTGGYCDACGKKLPPAAGVRSRRNPWGTADEPEPAAPAQARVAELLLTAAVLQLVLGGLFLVLGPVLLREVFGLEVPENFLPNVVLFTVPPVLVLGALYWWARFQPVYAALLALAVYPVLLAVNFAWSWRQAVLWLALAPVVLAVLGWALFVSTRPR